MVRVIGARNPSEWTGPGGNNTYVMMGLAPALVDAGTGMPAHLDEIAEALAGAPLAVVLITHGHPDHASGLPALLARWPSAKVVRYPDEGAVVAAGDVHLRPIRTPGHAPDHLCFFEPVSRDLFCGDLLRTGGSIVIPASQGGNVREYVASLRRMRALGPVRLLPGHGSVVDDPDPLFDQYLRHREEREAQVAAALRRGLTTADAIAASLYPGLEGRLLAAAVDTVRAHMIKLSEDGEP